MAAHDDENLRKIASSRIALIESEPVAQARGRDIYPKRLREMSSIMLERARELYGASSRVFAQGDAPRLPFADASFETPTR